MKTVTVEILDDRVINLLKILEELGIIRIHKDIDTNNIRFVDLDDKRDE